MPLEQNTVRFIDNFSTGKRGASSAEEFLVLQDHNYKVIFLHRRGSPLPFLRHFDFLRTRDGIKQLSISSDDALYGKEGRPWDRTENESKS